MKDIKLYKNKGGSLRFEKTQDNTILNDYKKLANFITQPAYMFGYLPLVLFGITTYGTYYYYKKNKLKTAAVFGAPLFFIFSQPMVRRLTPKNKTNQGNIN
tara:strand:+ start:2743 stop:3045 length:303 start_codon:yes stop_codon:yes gene_type:complete